MKTLPLLALFLLAGWSHAQNTAPQAVAVGKGSYASVPPPEVEKQARKTLERTLYLTPDVQGKAIPTNKWWTNLLVDKYAGQLWSFPHQTKADKDGLEINFPNRWNNSGSDPVSENPLRIGGRGFAPIDARAKSWSDWLVTFRLGESDAKYLDVTLGRGLPYVWIESKGVTPLLKIGRDATFFTETDVAELPATSDGFGLTFGGRSYGIFAPTGTRFSREGENIAMQFAGDKQFLVGCPLSKNDDLKLFRQFAFAIPRDSQMSWEYQPEKAQVVTKWRLTTQPLQGAEKRLIQGWLAHHWRDTTNDLKLDGPQYLTPRGTMKCAVGTDWTITYSFRGSPPFLPAPNVEGFDAARMHDYISRYATRTEYGGDTYWGGKHLTQFGQYMTLAHTMKHPDEGKLRDSLKKALTDWFTYTPGEKEHFFARLPNWRAMLGYNTSYGSEEFNDQHFHYGYFTHASALLGFADPQWLKDYGAMARLVAKQYANWDRNDKDFPFMRTLDIWEGHSWAGGYSSPTGNNQESSSEAMQGWAGLYLLGQALGDKEMTAAGAMGYALESRATMEYWFNPHGDNWAPSWKNKVVGMVWSGGNLYGTYFSGDPAWIWGIQWLPMSPALSYLVEDPAFAKKSFQEMWAARKASNDGEIDFDKIGPALGNVILGHAAQVNPDWTAQQLDELWDKGSKTAHENDTPGLTYYFAHANRTLGDIQTNYSIGLPLSRVYFNAKTKTTTFIVFNPMDTPQTAPISKDGKPISTIIAAPRQLTVVTNGKISDGTFTGEIGELKKPANTPQDAPKPAAPVKIERPNTPNLAANKPVMASSTENAGTPARNAVDGDDRTRWSSAFSDPQWITVDLQAPYALKQIILTWENAAAKSYAVETALDGTRWTPLSTVTNGTPGPRSFDAGAIKARYIRVTGTQRTTQYGYSLFEIEAYGAP
jgi:endoglucanase Acf2